MIKIDKKSNLYRISKEYLIPYLPLFLLNTLVSLFAGLQPVIHSKLVQVLMDDVFINKDMDRLIYVIILVLAASFTVGIAVYFRNYLSAYISGKLTVNIRNDMYKKIQKLSHSYFSGNKTGDLMTRFQIDTDRTQNIIVVGFRGLSEVLKIVGCVAYVFYINWSLALISLTILPFASIIIRKYGKRLRHTGKDIQASHGRLNNILQEGISGNRVIKAFASEDYEVKKYKEENDLNFKHSIKNRRLDARLKPIVEFFTTTVVALVALYGGWLVVEGKMSAGSIMAFLTAFGLIIDPMKRLTDINNNIQTSIPAVDRLYEIIDAEVEIEDKEDAIDKKEVIGKINFRNVYFTYDNKHDVIKNFSLNVRAGEMIALVGKSGSGKSTLVNLIPRFYDIKSGSIKIDDLDIRDYKLKSLRTHIGIVPQDTFLFSGSVYDNIIYGRRDATKEEVMEAAKMANAYNFIKELPEGFDTEVGERGVLLSGGQKQRISIARAILENPPIMILDEATSALDTESERLVQDALDKLMDNRTTFVIAHRLSTILHADKIVVMEDGEIKEVGKHEELLKTNGIYKKLYETQFGKIEDN